METADRLNALVNSFAFIPPSVQSPPTFSSPHSSSHSHSPSLSMIGQPSTSYSIQSRGIDDIPRSVFITFIIILFISLKNGLLSK